MLSKEEKEVIQQIGKYKYNQMKEKGLDYQEYLKYLEQKEQEKKLRKQMGNYQYQKMKQLGLNYEQYLQYKEEKNKEKVLKKRIGYKKYAEIKELGMTLEEYEEFQKETKYKNRQKYEEKNKIRYRTIRYIERYCDLEMKCQLCDEKAEIHHPNYKDYLKINLLCKEHHTALHNFELVPPEIIDLEKIAVKKPYLKEKEKQIVEQLENMKKDVLENNYTYEDLYKKYGFVRETIKKRFEKQKECLELNRRLKENGKAKQIQIHSKRKNELSKYKQQNNLTVKEISKITGIPVPTVTAISSGKTRIENLKESTKKKLSILKLDL